MLHFFSMYQRSLTKRPPAARRLQDMPAGKLVQIAARATSPENVRLAAIGAVEKRAIRHPDDVELYFAAIHGLNDIEASATIKTALESAFRHLLQIGKHASPEAVAKLALN